jgi:hypothetical protein
MSIEVLLQSIYYETDLIVAYLWFNGRDASFLKNDEFCSLLIDFCVSAGCRLLVECPCVATSWMPVRCYFLKNECLSSSSRRHLRRDEKMPVRLLVECPCVATGARVFSLVMWVEVSHGLRFYCLLVWMPVRCYGHSSYNTQQFNNKVATARWKKGDRDVAMEKRRRCLRPCLRFLLFFSFLFPFDTHTTPVPLIGKSFRSNISSLVSPKSKGEKYLHNSYSMARATLC